MSIQEEKLQAIADAIREKDGTTEPIPASNFPERIRAIQTGSSFAVPLVITADVETVITAVNGSKVVTGTVGESGTVTLTLPGPGDWSVTAQLEDKVKGPEIVSVQDGYTSKFSMKSRLPEGYTEVEYIESDGSSCIDTKIQPTGDTVFTIDVEPQQEISSASTDYTIFWSGTYRPLQNNGYYFGCRFRYYGVAVTKAPGAWTNASQSYVYINDDKTPRRMTIGMNLLDGKAYIVGESEITISSGTYPSNAHTILLLAGTVTSTVGIIAKLYSCQIEQGGQTVRDFVPCISPDGTVGMYDLSGNEFYANTSSGTFTAGPAV